MRPLFPSPPPPPPMPRGPDRAVLVRRPLQDRLFETLRFLAEEIEIRRVGGLGEAHAAGYVAGRLERAEQQATIFPFRTGRGPAVSVALLVIAAGLVSGMVALVPPGSTWSGALWPAIAAMLILDVLAWREIEGSAPLGQMLGSRSSQTVVGVRAAVGNTNPKRQRVVLLAPLDRSPHFPSRTLLILTLEIMAAESAVIAGLLLTRLPALRLAVGMGALGLLGIAALLLLRPWSRTPQPAILGAGELAALIAIAEELGELQQVELWTVASGAISVSDAGMVHLLERYPFEADTCFINLHHMTAGQPVYVTREGLLRERRSDRRLLALASQADAVDVTINAEPRRLRLHTQAAVLLRQGRCAITISSQPETHGFVRPDPGTLERCVKLVVGMIREMDQEEGKG